GYIRIRRHVEYPGATPHSTAASLLRQDVTMKLYYCDVLSPRKACAVAKYLKSPVEYVYVDLKNLEQQKPGYLAINPSGKVPTLVDGDRVVGEADAIMCYLSQRAGADLWPREVDRQIDVIQWLSWNAQHFTLHGGALYFEYIIKPWFGIGPLDSKLAENNIAGWRRFAAVLNTHLKGRRWVVGDGMTVADFS